jgi:hypothetical protein
VDVVPVVGAELPLPGTGVLAEPVPWPGEAALGMLELPEVGGLLGVVPETVGLGAVVG